MGSVRFRPEAEADLLDIHDYIARDNPQRARTFIEEIEALCAHLADAPMIGRSRSELAPNLRSIPFGRYLIFYEPEKNGVLIIRVLSGYLDLEVIFEA